MRLMHFHHRHDGHTHVHIAPRAGPLDARHREVRRVTLVAAAVDFSLAAGELLAGYLAHSQALIADGVHQLADLLTDAIVLAAMRESHRAADDAHPYGHGRIETMATFLLGAMLLLVAAGIGYDAVRRLFAPSTLLAPGWPALAAAGCAIAAKESVYWYTIHHARRLRSELLRANAWHMRSDALSSVVVLAGVGGVMAGLPYLDAVAATAVAAMIGTMGLSQVIRSLRELIDTGLDAEEVEAIRRTIMATEGVRTLHLLRTRRMGPDVVVDVHIQVGPELSVSEGHQIAESVRERLIADIEAVNDVTVHIDPEDDEAGPVNAGLPGREELMRALRVAWEGLPGAERIERMTLHYLDGRVHVDVVLPLDPGSDVAACATTAGDLERAAQGVRGVGEVRVYFH